VVCFVYTHNTVCIQCWSLELENDDFMFVHEMNTPFSHWKSISFKCIIPLGCFKTIVE
jgi:hypothetical protein